MADKTKRRVPVSPVMAAIVIVVLAVGGALFWYLETHDTGLRDTGPELMPEAKAYVRHLQLSDVEMQAKESVLAGAVVEITGNIGNSGDQPLNVIEITCVFYDPYGQVILRRRVPIVTRRMGGLQPGETKSFRLAFDDIPEEWNQVMPQMVIANIEFGGQG